MDIVFSVQIQFCHSLPPPDILFSGRRFFLAAVFI
jgi:hypothetical protein